MGTNRDRKKALVAASHCKQLLDVAPHDASIVPLVRQWKLSKDKVVR